MLVLKLYHGIEIALEIKYNLNSPKATSNPTACVYVYYVLREFSLNYLLTSNNPLSFYYSGCDVCFLYDVQAARLSSSQFGFTNLHVIVVCIRF